MKFCKDCTHYEMRSGQAFCSHTDNPGAVDLVSGNRIFNYVLCGVVRADTRRCGPLGDWYEPATLDGKLDMLVEEKSRTIYLVSGGGEEVKAYAFRSAAEKRKGEDQIISKIDFWEKQ